MLFRSPDGLQRKATQNAGKKAVQTVFNGRVGRFTGSGRSPSARCGTSAEKYKASSLMVIGTQQKNRRHLPRCLLQKIIHSDFLRRHYPHQVKGSKFRYFLSACFTSSPVFDCDCILHPLRTNCKRGQRRAQRCKTFFTQFLGRFTQVLLQKKVKYGIFKADAYPPP